MSDITETTHIHRDHSDNKISSIKKQKQADAILDHAFDTKISKEDLIKPRVHDHGHVVDKPHDLKLDSEKQKTIALDTENSSTVSSEKTDSSEKSELSWNSVRAFIVENVEDQIAEIQDGVKAKIEEFKVDDRFVNINYKKSDRAIAKNTIDKIGNKLSFGLARVLHKLNGIFQSITSSIVTYKGYVISAMAIGSVILASQLVWLTAVILPILLAVGIYLFIYQKPMLMKIVAFAKNPIGSIGDIFANKLKDIVKKTEYQDTLSRSDYVKTTILLGILFIMNSGNSWSKLIALPGSHTTETEQEIKEAKGDVSTKNIQKVNPEIFKIFEGFSKLSKVRSVSLLLLSSLSVLLSIAVVFVPGLQVLGAVVTIMALPSPILIIGVILLVSMLFENLNALLPTQFQRNFKRSIKYLGSDLSYTRINSPTVQASAAVLLIGLFGSVNSEEEYSLEQIRSIAPGEVLDKIKEKMSLTAVQKLAIERFSKDKAEKIPQYLQKLFLDKLSQFVQKNQDQFVKWMVKTNKIFSDKEISTQFEVIKKSLFDEKHKLSEEEIQDVSDKTMAYLMVKDIASITSWILNADKLRESRIEDHMASAIEPSMIEESVIESDNLHQYREALIEEPSEIGISKIIGDTKRAVYGVEIKSEIANIMGHRWAQRIK